MHWPIYRFSYGIACLCACTAASVCPAQPAPGAAWPEFLGNSSNAGTGLGVGTCQAVRWKFLGYGSSKDGSAVIDAHNTVYFAEENGTVYAVDGALGTKKWGYTTDGNVITAPALASNGLLYIGNSQGTLEAIDAATGAGAWFYQTPHNEPIDSSPTIGPDGTIYFGCNDGYLYAVSPTTHQTVWTFATSGTYLTASPAIPGDGNVYFTSDDNKLYAIKASSGQLQWSYTADSSIYGSPVIGGGGAIIFGSYDGTVYSINQLGAEEWSFRAGGQIDGTVLDASPFVFFGDSTGKLYKIDEFGQGPYWTVSTGAEIQSTPIAESNTEVAVANVAGSVTVVEPVAGAEICGFSTSTTVNAATQPALGMDGAIYLGAGDGYFYAFDGAKVSNLYTVPAKAIGGTTLKGVVQINEPAGPNGETVWMQCNAGGIFMPANVQIPAGKSGASFDIPTAAVSSTEVHEWDARPTNSNYTGISSVEVDQAAISNFYVSPSSVVGGNSTWGVVQLNGKAGPSGDVVTISGGGNLASPPAQVTVPANSTGVSFPIPTNPVSGTTSFQLTATFGSSTMNAPMAVETASVSKFYATPSSIAGGMSTSGVVQLNGEAGSLGDAVSIQSSSSSVTVPQYATVAAGSTGKSFTITSTPVSVSTNVTLTAIYVSTLHFTLTVNPYPISNFYTNPSSVVGGANTSGVVQLAGKAGPNGDMIALKSSDTHVVVPSSVTVPAGITGKSFPITTKAVTTTTQVTLTATLGSSQQTTVLTLKP